VNIEMDKQTAQAYVCGVWVTNIWNRPSQSRYIKIKLLLMSIIDWTVQEMYVPLHGVQHA